LKAKYGGQILTWKEKWRDFDELIQELKGNPAERDSELLADLLNELKDFDRELWPVANTIEIQRKSETPLVAIEEDDARKPAGETEKKRRLIKSLQPSDELLLLSLDRMKAQSSEDKLAGLYTAIELCKLNRNLELLDISTVQRLLSDVEPKVRQASLYLLEIVSEPSTQEWILKKLSDPVATVRAQAIRAIGWLAGAASATHILPLLSDPNDEVRIETLYTLRNIRKLKFEHLSQALANYSAEVLRVTQELLLEMSKEPSYGSH
jgi:hypothetical protein